MRPTIAFVVRLLVLVVLYGTGLLLAAQVDDGLGAGLLLFLAYVVVALAWSFVDARRIGFLRALGLWCLLAVVVAPVLSIGAQGGELDSEVLEADLVSFVPFMLALVGVPALVGSGIGSLTRGRAARAVETA